MFTGGARELHLVSNGDFNKGKYPPYPIEASTSCSLHEVEYFQPTFGVSSFVQHNRSREAGNQPNVQILQDGTFIWRIPKVSMQTKFSCNKKLSFLHGLKDVYRSLPKWERNWLQYPHLLEFYSHEGRV